MIKEITVDRKKIKVSHDVNDFFSTNDIKRINAGIALSMLDDCIDTIYEMMKPDFSCQTNE